MRTIVFFGFLFLLTCWACESPDTQAELHSSIHPKIIGNPFGMMHWEIDKDMEGKFQGIRSSYGRGQRDFAHMHLTVGLGEFETRSSERDLDISPMDEGSSPGLYSLTLEESVRLQITPSDRCGLFSFQFSQSDTAFFYLSNPSPSSSIHFYPHAGEVLILTSLDSLDGQPYPGLKEHYLLKMNKRYKQYGIWEGNLIQPGELQVKGQEQESGFYFKFPVDSAEVIQVKMGVSWRNLEGARRNLNQEIPDWDFSTAHTFSLKKWREVFLQVDTLTQGSLSDSLASSLYKMFLVPRIMQDVDGIYPSPNDATSIEVMTTGNFYTGFSCWNSLEDAHPRLLAKLQPEKYKEMIYAHNILKESAGTLKLTQPVNWEECRSTQIAAEALGQLLSQ